jgi:hypothetical protein
VRAIKIRVLPLVIIITMCLLIAAAFEVSFFHVIGCLGFAMGYINTAAIFKVSQVKRD